MEKAIDSITENELKKNTFLEVVYQIDKELNKKGSFNIEYYILFLSSSISKDLSVKTYEYFQNEVLKYINMHLLQSSETYNSVFNDEELCTLFNDYFKKIVKYYYESFIKESKHFEDYVDIENSAKSFNKKNISTDELGFSIENIQNTMALLNESLRLYYEVYNNRVLIATFSDEQKMQFRIKESELAHLLGINLVKIIDENMADALNLPDNLKKILLLKAAHFKEKDEVKKLELYKKIMLLDPYNSSTIELLHRFLDTKNGNLFEYEEDRIKKVLNGHEYNVRDFGSKNDGKIESSRVYSKANIKAKAFIKFKPLEDLSMLLSLPDNHELIKIKQKNIEKGIQDPSQYDVLISDSDLSENYKYTTLLNNIDRKDKRRYFESLLIKTPEGIEELKNVPGAKATITTKVVLAPDDGATGTTKERIFSVEKQKEFIEQVFSDFNKVDFTELITYFNTLVNTKRK
ncbi:MAG: hypothetical protein E7170_01175 [Firmicutes bacterium]|nr:hypothetical protein [Bacillota bacterium]